MYSVRRRVVLWFLPSYNSGNRKNLHRRVSNRAFDFFGQQKLPVKMNVTKSNFEECLPLIAGALDSCSFFAVDLEMTGIELDGVFKNSLADIPAVRYQKMKEVVSTYSVIQVGICTFHREDVAASSLPATNGHHATEPSSSARPTYSARPFNAFVFPANGNVTLSASTVQFLTEHNMNFDKWFYEGVPFVNAAKEQALLDKLEEKHEDHEHILLKRAQDLANLKELARGIAAVFATPVDSSSSSSSVPHSSHDTAASATAAAAIEDEWSLQHRTKPLNAYWRLLVRQLCEREYPDLRLEVDRSVSSWNKPLVIHRFHNDKAREAFEAHKRSIKLAEINAKVGFRRIFKMFRACGKPLITHNGLFDLLYLYDAFEGRLPETYAEFKVAAKEVFPQVFDTKHLVSVSGINSLPQHMVAAMPAEQQESVRAGLSERFSQTSLGGLFDVVQKKAASAEALAPDVAKNVLLAPRISFDSDFQHYVDCDAAHEAGYDAYMTSSVFAFMLHHSQEFKTDINEHANTVPMFKSMFSCCIDKNDLVSSSEHARYFVGCVLQTEKESIFDRRRAFEAALPQDASVSFRRLAKDAMLMYVDNKSCPPQTVRKAMDDLRSNGASLEWATFDEWLAHESSLCENLPLSSNTTESMQSHDFTTCALCRLSTSNEAESRAKKRKASAITVVLR